ncbi:MAG: flagellar motor protein MotA, partial [Phyllobacteriaceae bacterium]|nr:flagellar motor protein MotA [Phyllobacteriaceae bacterium]
WTLFLTAGPVGKGVMIVLLAASVRSWAAIGETWLAHRRLARAVRAARRGDGVAAVLTPLIAAGRRAWGRGDDVADETRRAACEDAMTRGARDLVLAAERGLADLAVIAATSPFVGLFGTVWGIMASFGSLGAAQDTSIAAVAPGIAEALAATAWGLAAAIPASVGFNRLGAAFARLTVEFDGWIGETVEAGEDGGS